MELAQLKPEELIVFDAAEALLKSKFGNAGYIIFVHSADEAPDRARQVVHAPCKEAAVEMALILLANIQYNPGAEPTTYPQN